MTHSLVFSFFKHIELPETKPFLKVERNHYEAGDILRANCSSPPSRPRVELKLLINNLVVSKKNTLKFIVGSTF